MVQATRTELSVNPREVLGKKVKKMRREGVTPANIFGHNVEALPTEVPSVIEVDVSGLEAIDQALHVSDLSVPPGVTILTDMEQVVAKISPPAVEVVVEEEEEVTEEEAAAAEEGAPEAGGAQEAKE